VEVRTDGGAGIVVIDEDAQVHGCCCAERGGVRDGAGSRRWWCMVAARMVRDSGENGGGTAAAAMEMARWLWWLRRTAGTEARKRGEDGRDLMEEDGGAAGWFEVAGAEARRWTVAGAVVRRRLWDVSAGTSWWQVCGGATA